MHTKTKITLLTIVLICGACAEIQQNKMYQATRDVTTTTMAKVSTVTTKAAGRMRDYLARKEVLEQFHDAGEHSEDALLGVLRRAGVGTKTASTAKPATGSTGKPKPSSIPSTTPSSGTPVPSAGPGKSTGAMASTTDNKFPSNYKGSYRWPLDAGIVSSEFGQRWGKMHKGLDVAADVGEPVYAAAAGEVIYSGNGMRGYGNAIVIRHDDRATSLYAHNSVLSVKVGQKVTQGEQIALLGNTGHSTGPHVHFEIRSGDAPVDPRTLLPKSMNAWLMPDTPMLNRNELFAGIWSVPNEEVLF